MSRSVSLAVPSSWNPSLRVAVFISCALPFLALVNAIATDALGPDPAEQLMHVTGEWVLRLLVLVLLATPLARYGWPRVKKAKN